MVGGIKGGTGKSSLCVNLATWLAAKKRDVLILDTDPQGTSVKWASGRKSRDLSSIPCVQKLGDIAETVISLGKKYKYVIVDAGGSDSTEMRSGLIAIDYLISPFQASQFDIDTTVEMDNLIRKAKLINRKLKSNSILSRLSTNPMVDERQEALVALEEYKTLQPLDDVIYERKIYKDAAKIDRGVIEMNNKKAIQEIEAIASGIFNL